MIDLDALEVTEKSLSPGPWTAIADVFQDDHMVMQTNEIPLTNEQANSNVVGIAILRNAAPDLLAELRTARAVVEATKALTADMTVQVSHFDGSNSRIIARSGSAFPQLDDVLAAVAAYKANTKTE